MKVFKKQIFSIEEAKRIIAEAGDITVIDHQQILMGRVGSCSPEQWVVDRLTGVLGKTLPTQGNAVEKLTPPPRVSKYLPGSEVFWHLDENYAHYDLRVVVVLLSDEFEGGDFQFVDPNREHKTVRLKVGEGVLFDGRVYHRVSKITSGARWSLGAWVDVGGPR